MQPDAVNHVLAFALEHPWALTDSMRSVVAGVLARRLRGIAADPDVVAHAIEARTQRTSAPSSSTRGGVAVIPIQGVIAPRMNLLTQMSGGTTFQGLTAALHDALALQPKAIILDIDSPGGNVAGATEFAREVLKARAKVPVIAQAEHLMGSAAFWVGACATEIVASPSSLVGAVGVYTIYDDISAALEADGIKREVLAAGEFKGEGVDGGPLTDDARAYRKSIIAKYYGRFVADVAAGRGVSVERVRDAYGKGRVLDADSAREVGMVNRVATLAETLDRFGVAPVAAMPEPALDLPHATAQELLAATAQERDAWIAEQLDLTRQTLELQGVS